LAARPQAAPPPRVLIGKIGRPAPRRRHTCPSRRKRQVRMVFGSRRSGAIPLVAVPRQAPEPTRTTDNDRFDLGRLLEARRGEGAALHEPHLNAQAQPLLRTIGFDRAYVRAEGACLYDADGARYLDMLAGFGVHALGRNHPEIAKALHDAVDRGLADLVQFDSPLLPGLLAERLLAHAPGLDRAYFCNSGTEAVE